MRRIYYVTGFAMLIVGLVAYSLAHRTGRAQAIAANKNDEEVSETHPNPSELSAILTVLDRLEHRLSALESRQVAPPAPHHELVVSAASADEPVAPGTHGLQERENRRQAEVERRLKTESRDRSWSGAAEDAIRQTLASVSGRHPQYAISRLTCLTSVCSVEFATPDPTAAGMDIRHGISIVEGVAAFDFHEPVQKPDGTYIVAYELFRKGYAVPGDERTVQ
jgi:hypothetical protein